MSKLKKQDILIGMLAFACIPFTLAKLFCWLTGTQGTSQFSEAKFLEEYFRLFGLLVIVLIGAWYAEYLMDKRIKAEKVKEINRCQGYFRLLNSKLVELRRLNHHSITQEEIACFDEIENLIETIALFLQSRSHIMATMQETGLVKLIEIQRLKNNIKKDMEFHPFSKSNIEKMLLNSKNLAENRTYEIESI